MKLLIVPDGSTIERALEIQKSTLLGITNIKEDMSDHEIALFLNNVVKKADGKVYGIIDEKIMPIESVPFIKAYLNRQGERSRFNIWYLILAIVIAFFIFK